MCKSRHHVKMSSSTVKTSSFLIDNILKNPKDADNNNNKSINDNNNNNNNNNNYKDDRNVLRVHESSGFKPYARPNYSSYDNSNLYHKSYHNYHGLDRFKTAYPQTSYSYLNGMDRLHFPAATATVAASPYFNSALDAQWPMIGGYGYHHFGYSPYLRGLSLSSSAKRKGGQVRFTQQQTTSLETRFRSQKYLSPENRRTLAIQLNLSDRQVKTWFQNRRAKWRRSKSTSSTDILEHEDKHSEDESSCSDKEAEIYEPKKSPILIR